MGRGALNASKEPNPTVWLFFKLPRLLLVGKKFLIFFNFVEVLGVVLLATELHSLPVGVPAANDDIDDLVEDKQYVVEEKKCEAYPADHEILIFKIFCRFVDIEIKDSP